MRAQEAYEKAMAAEKSQKEDFEKSVTEFIKNIENTDGYKRILSSINDRASRAHTYITIKEDDWKQAFGYFGHYALEAFKRLGYVAAWEDYRKVFFISWGKPEWTKAANKS